MIKEESVYGLRRNPPVEFFYDVKITTAASAGNNTRAVLFGIKESSASKKLF